MVLTVVLCLQTLLAIGMLGGAIESFAVRICPDGSSSLDVAETVYSVDYRARVGNDVLRVYRVSIGTDRQGRQVAEVSLCMYDRIPCGIVSTTLRAYTEVKNQRGEAVSTYNGSGCWTAVYSNRYVELRPGDTYITVEYARYGEQIRLEIPLPEGVTA